MKVRDLQVKVMVNIRVCRKKTSESRFETRLQPTDKASSEDQASNSDLGLNWVGDGSL